MHNRRNFQSTILQSLTIAALFTTFTGPSPSLAETAKIELNRFEDSIKAYEIADRKQMPPLGGTEFLGSSSIAMWDTIAQDFPGWKAFGRGFGGSTIPESTYYADRIVIKYKPKRIIFYAGTNDIADGHSAKDVLEEFKKFVKKIQSALPSTQIYFISMSMAPSRIQWEKEFIEGNKLIKEFCKTNKQLHYIDVTASMQNKDGKPVESLFRDDMLHMKRPGYEIWIAEIKRAVKQ